eukprot:13579465-Alexandrium_andersonii.AAC.1
MPRRGLQGFPRAGAARGFRAAREFGGLGPARGPSSGATLPGRSCLQSLLRRLAPRRSTIAVAEPRG